MEHPIARFSFAARVLGLCLVLGFPFTAQAEETATPAAKHGLQKFGSTWVFQEELAQKQQLDQLEELIKRTIPLRRQIDLAVSDNAIRWQRQKATAALLEQVASEMRRGAVGTDEEKKVQSQIDRLKRASKELQGGIAPDEFGGQPHIRAMLETLTLAHQQASIVVAQLSVRMETIEQDYDNLPKSVRDWFDQHPGENIGPLLRREQIEQTIRRAHASIDLDSIPVFLVGPQKRLGVVLDDQYPTIVTLVSKDKRLIITSNMAYSIGLRELGKPEPISLPGGKATKARRGELPQVRLGSAALQNVSVYVLEPSDEYLGGFIGLNLFQAWAPRFADSGVSLNLDPTSQVSTASR
ncbi:hypothetical protein GC197_03815 [bacterium]|nr:hypothetical protein [bacterium]